MKHRSSGANEMTLMIATVLVKMGDLCEGN